MNLHLAEIAAQIAPGAHAALLVDQAGWHLSGRLVMPPNNTLIRLPAKCPELNPQENVWQFLRDNWLSNQIFKSYDDVVDHCCEAWNNLRRSTLADHVHRPSQLGPWVLINKSSYYRAPMSSPIRPVVFRPEPVSTSTVVSLGRIAPRSSSFVNAAAARAEVGSA